MKKQKKRSDNMIEITTDLLLNGQMKLMQPANGYRVSIDPFIVAGLLPLSSCQNMLDVGCGVGTISLLALNKNPTIHVTAIDVDKNMCEICLHNSRENHKEINVINDDISMHSFDINSFDLVVTNPPYYNKNSHRISDGKLFANFETISLETWIISSLRSLKNGGFFAIIHVASRISEIMRILNNRVGDLRLYPIYTKADSPAKRIVIIGKKGGKGETQIMPEITVYNDDGSYTDVIKNCME